MKLQILIPRYNETEGAVKALLDSINIQQGIDFNNFEVVIWDDGSETELSRELLNTYPYHIIYNYYYEHAGLAATRQKLIDEATAEYVMYCDVGVMFMSALGLYTIFAYITNGFDVLNVAFIRESKSTKTKQIKYDTYNNDDNYVVGKVYRRRHLIDNKIVWHSDIDAYIDLPYHGLALATAKIKEVCKVPLYLWSWNNLTSIQAEPLYQLKTYNQYIKANGYLVRDLLERKLLDLAKLFIGSLIYNTYYLMNKPIWLDPMNAKYRYETEKCFKQYYLRHKEFFDRLSPEMYRKVVARIKQQMISEGVILEKFTFDTWIDHIEDLD